jgi:hypothetical protein
MTTSDLVQIVTRRHYNHDTDIPDAIEATFQLFLTAPDGTYTMKDGSLRTRVPVTTLSSWRKQARVDLGWRPSSEYFSRGNRSLPDKAEEMIASFIRRQYLDLGRRLDRPTLQSVIFMPLHSMVAEPYLQPLFSISNVRRRL